MSTSLPPAIVVAQSLAPLPLPRVPVIVRGATLADLPFIDSLQKKHAKMVGWMPGKQLEEKIGAGHVLVAEEADDSAIEVSDLKLERRVGYCIGHDQYFKRDDVGIIY